MIHLFHGYQNILSMDVLGEGSSPKLYARFIVQLDNLDLPIRYSFDNFELTPVWFLYFSRFFLSKNTSELKCLCKNRSSIVADSFEVDEPSIF